MHTRHTALWGALLLLCGLSVAPPALALTYFVDATRPNDSGTCLTEAAACKTGAGALTKMLANNTCGDIVQFKDDQTHQFTTSHTLSQNCETNRKIFRRSNDGSTRPILTTAAVLSNAWTVHFGTGCTTGATCTWKHALTADPRRNVYQNLDNPPTPTVAEDPAQAPTPNHMSWADVATSAGTCPNALNSAKNHAYCWNGGQLYMNSIGNPFTTYTQPGVSVSAIEFGNAESILRIANSGYTIDGLHFRAHSGTSLFLGSTTTSIKQVSILNSKLEWSEPASAGWSADNAAGDPGMMLQVEAPSIATGILFKDTEIAYPGRDGGDFSKSGSQTGILFENVIIHDNYNHSAMNTTHASGQAGGAGPRVATFRRLYTYNTCTGLADTVGTVSPGTITIEYSLFANAIPNGDPRLPLNAECAGSRWPHVLNDATQQTWIVRNSIFKGADRAFLFSNANSVFQGARNLYYANTKAGIHSDGGGGSVTDSYSVYYKNGGTGSCSVNSCQLGCMNGVCATTFDGNFNLFRNDSGTDSVAFLGNAAKTLAQLRAFTGTHANSIQAAPGFVNEGADNFNPAAGSPLIGAGVGATGCIGANCEIGPFELPFASAGSATVATVWQVPVTTAFPPVRVSGSSCAHPTVNGDSGRTATLSVLDGTTVQLSGISGSTPPGAVPLTVAFDAGCLIDSMKIGNRPEANWSGNAVAQTVSVTNSITGGSVPTFNNCVARNSAPSVVAITLNSTGGALTPGSSAQGLSCRASGVLQTVSVPGVLTGTTYDVTFTAPFPASPAAIDCSYSQGTGDITNPLGELTAFTNTPCANLIEDPPVAPVLASGTVSLATPGTVTVEMLTDAPPMLPTNGATGFTLAPKTITGSTSTGAAQFALSVTPDFAPGESRQLCYVLGGNVTNSDSPTPTELAAGCVMVTAPSLGSSTYTSTAWQLFVPDLLVPTHALAPLDYRPGTRLQVATTVDIATADAPEQFYDLECAKNGGGYQVLTTEFEANDLRISTHANAVNGQACSAAVLGSTVCLYQTAPQGTSLLTLPLASRLTQIWSLEFLTGLSLGDTYSCQPRAGAVGVPPVPPLVFVVGNVAHSIVSRQ